MTRSGLPSLLMCCKQCFASTTVKMASKFNRSLRESSTAWTFLNIVPSTRRFCQERRQTSLAKRSITEWIYGEDGRGAGVGARCACAQGAPVKKGCMTGPGSARPVVSINMASICCLRFNSFESTRMRSPRTLQQRHPLFSCTLQ